MEITFAQVEGIIGKALPASARRHRSWWDNDWLSQVQSGFWLDAGLRDSHVDMGKERVKFMLIPEREEKYKAFFDALLKDLRNRRKPGEMWALPDGSRGRNFQKLGGLPIGSAVGDPSVSFAHRRRLRVEFYIGRGDEAKNKHVYDTLHTHRQEIEARLRRAGVREEVSWERLDHRIASRVAIYRQGSIEYSKLELDRLRVWAVVTLVELRNALSPFLPR